MPQGASSSFSSEGLSPFPLHPKAWRRGVSHRRDHTLSAGKMDCPAAVASPLRTHPGLCRWVALLQPQMTLALQVPRLCSKGLALVPLLKEELRATGHSGNSRRCHCCHFF